MNIMKLTSRSLMGAAGGLLLAAVLSPVSAQSDSRWAPFIGCWAVAEDVTSSRLCIEPSDQPNAALWISELDDGESTEEIVVVDGAFRPLTDAECEGESAARFSADGRRIYLDGTLDCDGGVQRSSSGVIAMISGSEWVDVRSLESDGRSFAFIQRYVRIDDDGSRSRAMARAIASAAPRIEDIIDVSNNTSASVSAAWLSEAGLEEAVDARGLIAMDDAGVPSDVVDMVVALSNPYRFAFADGSDVEMQDGVRGGGAGMVGSDEYSERYSSRRYGYWGGFYGRASFYDDFYLQSRYGYGYSPYSRYGAYDPWLSGYGGYGGYGYRPTPIYVIPTNLSGGRNGGTAIAGRGYSGPSSNPSTGSSSRGSNPPAASGGSSGSSGSSTGTTRRAKPRGGGGSNPPVASSSSSGSTGSSTGTARRAKPRGGGGI